MMNNLEQIKSMLPPRDSYPRMMVWDVNESKAVERIVTEINSDGSCRTVSGGSEYMFLNNERYSPTYWNHCKPIQKPSTEPWTDRFKIMNWCHQQKELVVVSSDYTFGNMWYSHAFNDPFNCTWNKINPETNELMYAENKVFCDAECLVEGE